MAPIEYQDLKTHPSTFLAMTGLSVEEFRALLILFGNAWTRSHPPNELGQGRPPVISSMPQRLLFILYYYKCYPLQEVLGYLFGISQERACQCVGEFTEVLLLAMRDSHLAPERVSEGFKKKLSRLGATITSSTAPSGPSSGPRTQRSRSTSTAERATSTR